jgi:hypothetical protein
MTTFNDLIAELAHENLLDEINLVGSGKPSGNYQPVNIAEAETPAIPIPDFLSLSENYDLKLPDFSILTPENDPHFEENQVKHVFPTQEPIISMQNTQNLIRYQTRRGSKSRSKAKKLCRTCGFRISGLSLNCRHCSHRVVSEYYYYSLILLGFTLFTVFVWMIVTSKSYN